MRYRRRRRAPPLVSERPDLEYLRSVRVAGALHAADERIHDVYVPSSGPLHAVGSRLWSASWNEFVPQVIPRVRQTLFTIVTLNEYTQVNRGATGRI